MTAPSTTYEAARMLRKLPAYMLIGVPPDEILNSAICNLDNSSLFSPRTAEEIEEYGKRHIDRRIRRAIGICNGDTGDSACPVRAECLRWALENGEEGVWGGVMITAPVLRKAGFRARKA